SRHLLNLIWVMEEVEAVNEATPPLKEEDMTDNADVIVSDDSDESVVKSSNEGGNPENVDENLDDSDDSAFVPEENSDDASSGEMIPVERDAALDAVEAVIDHSRGPDGSEVGGVGPVEAAAIEIARAEQAGQIEMDDERSNSGDTLPMYDEGDEQPAAEDAATNGDVEMKDDSPSTEGESSRPLPETAEEDLSNEVAGNLPASFPHCYICGFDRETVFMRERKATTGQHKNKQIFRNRCVRKACIRFFGPTYVWNGKTGEYVKIAEESGACSRPFANAPRAEKFPALDYERAAKGGVYPPIESNGFFAKATKTAAVDIVSGAPSTSTTSDSPTPAFQKPSSSSKAPPPAAVQKPSTSRAPSAAKKPRKGYQWVEEDEVVPQPRPDPVLELARIYAAQNKADAAIAKVVVTRQSFGTQTGDEDHVVQILVDEMKAKATFRGLQPSDEIPMSAAISNRLFLTQKLLRSQTTEIKSLRKERDSLRENMMKVSELLEEYKKLFVADTTRLKEDVAVANKELRNYSLEAQNEAHKDIRDIQKIKNDVAKRLDDTDRYRRKVEASLEYQKSVTEEAESLADNYHRMSVELEKKILVAKMEEEDAKTKLNDAIYLTDNAKCTHCKVNERIKVMLTEQLGEKTLSAKNLAKEREDLVKKLENSERIAKIMNKENQQLKFEKSAWESNCHRFRSELLQLKGNKDGLVLASSFPSSSSIPPGEAAFTPQSTTAKESEEVSPERIGDDVIEIDRPQPPSSTSSAEEGELKSPRSVSPTSLAKLPPPPAPPPLSQLKEPSSPDHDAAFANWIPKERKVQEVPPEMAEAMRKVAESLEKGPPPKKEEKGPPVHKKEKRDEKGGGGPTGGKRSGGPHSSNPHHKNGEKKPKLEGGTRKEEKGVPPRPIPSIGSSSKVVTPGVMQKVAEKEKRERMEERIVRESSPIPYSSKHEPAYPAVVAKKSVKVPYNGPSSLTASGSTPSSSTSSPLPPIKHHKGTPEKKPLCFLPVAGSFAMPPLSINPRDQPPRKVPVDVLLRQAERLREIERERDRRAEMEHQTVMRGPDPFYDHVAASAAAADRRMGMPPLMNGGGGRFSDFDEELPWNQGRAPPLHPPRPGTPVQDWYYDAPSGHPGPPQPRQRSPGRYYDDAMYDPRAPRDQYGRLEPDFGAMRHPHHHGAPPPHPHPPLHPPHHGAPPLQAPPPGDAWRREWHDPNWSNEEPRRRSYWD
ncbi:hypothetical protein PENTCL1PPCAC_3500, partial [Pristionchus entomophagus]